MSDLVDVLRATARIKAEEYAQRTAVRGQQMPNYIEMEAADEIERLQHEVGVLSADVNHSIENGKNLRAEIERLRAALVKYGGHKEECGCLDIVGKALFNSECDCGLQEILHGKA